MNSVLEGLDPTKFVHGILRSSPSKSDRKKNDIMWIDLMKQLALPSSTTSEEVRQAAIDFFDPAERSDSNPIKHLFRQSYNGKKLVLFWNDVCRSFDSTENPEVISEELESLNNSVIKGEFPSFQALVCFGNYSPNVISGGRFGSPSHYSRKIFSDSDLDFTLAETQDLFSQFEREYGVKVDPEVVKNIHQLTGGHTGFTNLCGEHITDLMFPEDKYAKSIGTTINLSQWIETRRLLILRASRNMRYRSMFVQHWISWRWNYLLESLCHGARKPMLDSSEDFDSLRQLGFASVQKIDDKDYLVIKSEIVRRLVMLHIIHDDRAFDVMTMVDQNHVNLPKLLIQCIRKFIPDIITDAYEIESKIHETQDGQRFPSEFAYYAQLRVIINETLLRIPGWEVKPEVEQSASDILLSRDVKTTQGYQENMGLSDLRVGLGLTASASKSSLEKHAARDYPQTANLTQYAVVNFTPILPQDGFKNFFLPGIDRNGAKTLVPVYYILHNENFKQVHLFYASSPEAKKPTVTTILGQKFEGEAGDVVA